jgi:hypothetical protein
MGHPSLVQRDVILAYGNLARCVFCVMQTSNLEYGRRVQRDRAKHTEQISGDATGKKT